MLFDTLDKLRRNSILSAILMGALGAVILICPITYVPTLVLVLGYTLVVLSIVMIMNFLASNKSLMEYIKFVGALIIGIAGLCVLVFRTDIMHVLTILFGVLLILDGGRTVIHALTYSRRSKRKGWWILLILSLLLVLAGLIILVNPWWDTPVKLMKVIGCGILFSAVTSGLRLIWTWPLSKSKEGENEDGK